MSRDWYCEIMIVRSMEIVYNDMIYQGYTLF